MIIGVVRYWDLGRSKAKRIVKIKAKDEEDFNNQLEREFKKHLVSENVGFDAKLGVIFAGFHTVGKFELISKKLDETI
jgi:hypothetical protein